MQFSPSSTKCLNSICKSSDHVMMTSRLITKPLNINITILLCLICLCVWHEESSPLSYQHLNQLNLNQPPPMFGQNPEFRFFEKIIFCVFGAPKNFLFLRLNKVLGAPKNFLRPQNTKNWFSPKNWIPRFVRTLEAVSTVALITWVPSDLLRQFI